MKNEIKGRINVPTFVKWAGGKTQLLGQFVKFFPEKMNRYFEPFLGGGAVFFYLKKYHGCPPKEIVLSDNNEELINCFRVVRDNPDKLIALLKQHKKNHNKAYYYKMRNKDPERMSPISQAARLIYLNKTCFNGLYRVNSKGKFNVPIGSYKNPGIVIEPSIREASRLLQEVKLEVLPFQKILSMARKGDFVYFDPPYMPLSKTSSFTSYTKDSFSERNQEELADIFDKLDKKGCRLMLSNSNHPFLKRLYAKQKITTVKATRAINSKGSERGKINEIVVTNY